MNMFNGIFDTSAAQSISLGSFLLCILVSLVLGLALAYCYMFKNRVSKSLATTIAVLPTVVCVVILLVNGNLGTAVAVAGTFGLVRFRSAPGSAKEIAFIFLAMAIGLLTGMGYLGYAVLFAAILGLVTILLTTIGFGESEPLARIVRITMPEDIDYTGVFEPVFFETCKDWKITRVKTTNMGSMFNVTYQVTLKGTDAEKKMIDGIRIRNGNLEVSVMSEQDKEGTL